MDRLQSNTNRSTDYPKTILIVAVTWIVTGVACSCWALVLATVPSAMLESAIWVAILGSWLVISGVRLALGYAVNLYFYAVPSLLACIVIVMCLFITLAFGQGEPFFALGVTIELMLLAGMTMSTITAFADRERYLLWRANRQKQAAEDGN